MAKKTVAAKKRVVKVDAVGQAHIHSSFNNIIVTLANSEGQVSLGIQRIKEKHSLCRSNGRTRLCKGGF